MCGTYCGISIKMFLPPLARGSPPKRGGGSRTRTLTPHASTKTMIRTIISRRGEALHRKEGPELRHHRLVRINRRDLHSEEGPELDTARKYWHRDSYDNCESITKMSSASRSPCQLWLHRMIISNLSASPPLRGGSRTWHHTHGPKLDTTHKYWHFVH